MKRYKSNRTSLQNIKIIDLRKKIKHFLSLKNSSSLSRLNGILYGLLLSENITFFTYDRFDKLITKIENQQIISLR